MEIDLSSLLGQKPQTVWDEFVPIITNKNRTDVYLTNEISTPDEYNKLVYLLNGASEAENFYIHLNTPGGILDSANMLVNALRSTKANTTAILSGTVASAGTILALACTHLEIAPYTQFMIHNYSGSVGGKGKEAKDQMEFINSETNKSFRDYYKGFLTEEEIEDVIDDHDRWFDYEEVKRRWKLKGKFISTTKDK